MTRSPTDGRSRPTAGAGRRLTLVQARRLALAAQGFGRPQPGHVTATHLQRVVDRVAHLQIDSVNVVARAHEVPLYSRYGPYDAGVLARASGRAPRRLVEYDSHVAALMDVELWPAMAGRRAAWAGAMWPRVARIVAEHPDLPDRVLDEVGARGPIRAADIDHDEVRSREHWGWNWSQVKYVAEWLLHAGRLACADRTASFERRYDLPERVLPARVLDRDLSPEAGAEELARRALSALGVATTASVADYFRTPRAATAAALRALQRRGLAEPVTLDGWREAWLDPSAARPRRVEGQALVSPFDSLVWDRGRLQDLFGVHYRLGQYTPARDRVHGYYVYLFWTDEAITARVDLKADRPAGVLRVRSAWLEPGADAGVVALRLAAELRRASGWLGLADVAVEPVGSLAGPLASAVAG